jgi:NTE family protein
MYKNLIFSGGGVKGYIFLGVFKYLEENDLRKHVKSIAGASIGSLFALCFVLDYSFDDLYKIFTKIDLMENIDAFNGDIFSKFLTKYGIESGENLVRIAKIFIKYKADNEEITLKELYDFSKVELKISATCVNDMDCVVFDHVNYPDVKVVDVLRMSVSIPFFFEPVLFKEKYYVDGGLTNNYPIEIYKDELKETIGFLISTKNRNFDEKIENIEQYILCILKSTLNYIDYCKLKDYKKQTIVLNDDTNMLNLTLTKEKKDNMVDLGYKKTSEFFKKNN